MCGIYGTFNINIELPVFTTELNKIAHRGPDGYGVWQSPDQQVCLGHRRLAIIDPDARSNQPMQLGERYVLVYNGEIYNYIEVRRELEKSGVVFTTESDTEVLLQLLVSRGPGALTQLNGMWSFALYDIFEKRLLLSRDRLGKKPLYYVQSGEHLAFSSEMKNLFTYLPQLAYNQDYIDYSVQHVTDNESREDCLIQGIKKFPPGCYGIFQNGKLEMERYYFPEQLLQNRNPYKSFGEATEAFRELFESSCRLRMRSDVPVGSALSGGIDSGFLVSTIAKLGFARSGIYKALISSFPDSFLDETKAAVQVAEQAGVPRETMEVISMMNPDNLFRTAYQFEEISGTSPVPFLQLYRGFRDRNIVVSLDGHGSDELFGGYAADLFEKLKDDFPNILQMKRTINAIDKMYGFNNLINLKKTWPYFKQEVLRKMQSKEPFRLVKKESFYKQKLFHSTFTGILPTLLRNYDKYSMASGVEVRMPYLDYRIVEFAFSLPNAYRFRNGYSKAVVRNAARNIVPAAILKNKVKTGWNSPMGEWFSGPWREWMLDEIHSYEFKQCPLINAPEITRMVEDFLHTKKDHGRGQGIWVRLQPYLIAKANRLYAGKTLQTL